MCEELNIEKKELFMSKKDKWRDNILAIKKRI